MQVKKRWQRSQDKVSIINLYKTCIHICERTQNKKNPPKIHFIYTGNKKTEVLIFSLMFSQSLFTHLISLKFSKAANMFQILNWYWFITSSSLSFLRLNLSTSNFCAVCLLTANVSLTFTAIRQRSVKQSAPVKDGTSSILECHLLSINMWPIWL